MLRDSKKQQKSESTRTSSEGVSGMQHGGMCVATTGEMMNATPHRANHDTHNHTTRKIASIEDYPRYLFEGSFFTLAVFDLLFTAAMCWRLSHVGIRKAAVDTWVDIYEDEKNYGHTGVSTLNAAFGLRSLAPAAAPSSNSSSTTTMITPTTVTAMINTLTADDAKMHQNSTMMTPPTPLFALEHCIFASHFGFMIKDIFFCTRGAWELVMPVHHLGTCILLLMAYFSLELPGIRLLALSTSVMELGSASFCAWLAWRLKVQYVIIMTLSNTIYFACLCAIVLHGDNLPWWIHSAVALGLAFIIGRTAVLIQGMHKEYCVHGVGSERKMQ